MTSEQKANRILLDAARDVYAPQQRKAATVPVDRRCPACGVDRPRCQSATCIRGAA